MDVFIDRWAPEADLPLAKKLADAADRSRPAALLTVVDPGSRRSRLGARTVVDPAQRDLPR